MPNGYPDQDLAENFADFFVDKKIKIWNKLDQYALCKPEQRDGLTTLNKFNAVSDDIVK